MEGAVRHLIKLSWTKKVRGREMVREQMERLEEWENMRTAP